VPSKYRTLIGNDWSSEAILLDEPHQLQKLGLWVLTGVSLQSAKFTDRAKRKRGRSFRRCHAAMLPEHHSKSLERDPRQRIDTENSSQI